MFETPVGVWAGLGTIGLFGTVLGVGGREHRDARSVAGTVDAVSGSLHVSTGRSSLSTDAIRIGPHRVGTKDGERPTYEPFTDGPITPVLDGTLLWELLRGARPDHLFESTAEFETSLRRAQERDPTWRSDVDEVLVRSIRWNGIDATLVGT